MKKHIWLMSSVVVLGCSPVTEDRPATTTAALQGGSLDNGDPAVGVVWSSSVKYMCSGTLIAPHIVLTAAHCVTHTSGTLDMFFTGAGTAVATPDPASDPALTAYSIIDQQYDPNFVDGCPNQHDVALLRIGDRVHPGLIHVAASNAEVPVATSIVTAVGFGTYTSGGFSTIESKRTGTETVVSWPDAYNLLVTFGNSVADSGDSGSPIFYNNALVGVTSCHLDGTWPGHQQEYYARVDVSSSFITSTMNNWIGQCHDQCNVDWGPCDPNDCFCLAAQFDCYRWGCGENYPVISCFGGW